MSEEKNNLFRKEALAAMDDNSDVKEYVRVTRPSLLIILIALIICIVVALYWLFFGTTNLKIGASAIAFPHSSLEVQTVPFEGRVIKRYISHGNYVYKGTKLLTLLTKTAQSDITANKDGVVLSYKGTNETFQANSPVVYMLPQQRERTGREIIAYVKFKDLRWIKKGQQVQVTPADLTREEYGYAKGTVVSIDPYPSSKEEVARKLKLPTFSEETLTDKEAAYEVKILLNVDEKGNLCWSREKSNHLKFPIGSFCKIQVVTRTLKIYEVLLMKLEDIVYNIEDK